MKKNIPTPWIIFGLIAGIVFAIFIGYFFEKQGDPLSLAYKSYQEGENAKTVGERQEAFNKALKLYSDLEAQTHPIYGNGKIYYNIANTYFQLEEYSWAMYYYYQAQKLMPLNDPVEENLNAAAAKLNITPPKNNSIFNILFFFHYDFSLPQRLEIFTIFSTVTIALASAYIWLKKYWLKNGFLIAGAISTIFLFSLLTTHYLSPVEGVIVRSTSLYKDAGLQYAPAEEAPIVGGTKVEVLGVVQEGQWLKIINSKGTLGFVPADSIRLLAD